MNAEGALKLTFKAIESIDISEHTRLIDKNILEGAQKGLTVVSIPLNINGISPVFTKIKKHYENNGFFIHSSMGACGNDLYIGVSWSMPNEPVQ